MTGTPLAVIVPSRGRPARAAELARAVTATADPEFTTLVFALDHDDPQLAAYQAALAADAPHAEIMVPLPGGPQRMGPVLNWAAVRVAGDHEFTGFMGDDHRPRTPGWDRSMCAAIGSRPGVAYGNDLFQGQVLPTAVVMSSALIRILGYMAPPPLLHLWIDDFWRVLGELTHLEYLDGVIIEHEHPAAGKAQPDLVYLESGMNPGLMADDGWRWQQWREQAWPAEAQRLAEALA